MDFEKWVKRYPPVRQEQLRAGREKALQSGLLRKKDARVGNFIKVETTTNATDPRNISPREDEFMSVVGPYIAAVEKHAHHARFLVKGMNLAKRNAKMSPLLAKKRFIEIDYARFDMTINRSMLEVERTLMTSTFPRTVFPELHEAYDLMMQTTGTSSLGTRYTKLGGRNSGDLTTSIGNGLLNRFAVWMCLRKLPPSSWVSFHEGDDGIIGVDTDLLNQVVDNLQFLWTVGFQPKMDVYNHIVQTSFCGRFLVDTPGGLESYCDPLRTLSKIHTTCAMGDARELMCAKTLSYAFTDGTTPMVGPYSYAISTILSREISVVRLEDRLRRLVKSNELPWFFAEALRKQGVDIRALSSRPRPEVNNELRAAFAMRTGISIREQLEFEAVCWGWLSSGRVGDDLEARDIPFCYKPNVWYDINPY